MNYKLALPLLLPAGYAAKVFFDTEETPENPTAERITTAIKETLKEIETKLPEQPEAQEPELDSRFDQAILGGLSAFVGSIVALCVYGEKDESIISRVGALAVVTILGAGIGALLPQRFLK